MTASNNAQTCFKLLKMRLSPEKSTRAQFRFKEAHNVDETNLRLTQLPHFLSRS